ncbi:MAG: VWA domain-containing protein [Deltaproteobacteria bacterium]|nr:VWA domain-containing protein [Deltaproteobacteria bacterium]
MTTRDELMSMLFLADPETATLVREKLSGRLPPVTDDELGLIIEETIWGLSQETAFGHALATGLIELAGRTAPEHIEMFRFKVREVGAKSAAIGRIMATHLVPVLKTGDKRLIERFNDTTYSLLKIGPYTLESPFETLSCLIESDDIESGLAFLELLGSALSPDLSYNRCKHLCHIIPRAVQSFPPSRRLFQIGQLTRVARTDSGLVDGFLDGMQRGASLLDGETLPRFVSEGLTRFNRDKAAGIRFLSLESQQARDLADELQVAVSFSQIQHGLNRYLQARTGRTLTVCPLSELSEIDLFTPEKPLVCSRGNRLYLPDEISHFNSKSENLFLYKCLTRLEACYHEFGTYEFDLEMAIETCNDSEEIADQGPGIRDRLRQLAIEDGNDPEEKKDRDALTTSDLHVFCRIFSNPALAADLMTVFEHGRIRIILEQRYPGIIRQSLPVLIREAKRIYPGSLRGLPLEALYLKIALGVNDPEIHGQPAPETGTIIVSVIDAITQDFCRIIEKNSRVEDCAALVWKSFPRIEPCLKAACSENDSRLKTPFGRGLQPDSAMDRPIEAKAFLLKRKLAEKGIKVYKSRIREHLAHHGGKIGKDDILNLVRLSQGADPSETAVHTAAIMDLSDLDLSEIPGLLDTTAIYDTLPATWYREWDSRHSDYLHNHVRVVDRIVEGASAGFYDRTLERYRELVSQIRYAFEMMKPHGLKLLRNWTEGDELDYRAMLDFVLDKKAGLIPSDRLYIKRIKQERNVAVLLLVDLSRSTGNTLGNSPSDVAATVLDVEKEAMVLFCEALGIVGDTFAIAGFSGNGRLSVDYTHIKGFDEPLDDVVRRRISGLTPQRGTRMGAAIRHATAQFDKIPANIRLMVVLGDGFPNDVDYKREYAISDTRKAIGEALSHRIHTHAITVNMQNDARLDDLYGSVHHNVISDVRELPAKLLRIYGALTRSRPGA